MQSAQTVTLSSPSGFMKLGSFISGLCVLVGSLLVTMQSRRTNPPDTFDVIQTRVDAFVR
jgi:hypothetical protein